MRNLVKSNKAILMEKMSLDRAEAQRDIDKQAEDNKYPNYFINYILKNNDSPVVKAKTLLDGADTNKSMDISTAWYLEDIATAYLKGAVDFKRSAFTPISKSLQTMSCSKCGKDSPRSIQVTCPCGNTMYDNPDEGDN